MTLYELQPNLSLNQNYRAISHAQLDLAIQSLQDTDKMEKGVYAARKCMKRLRGLVHLYRDMMLSDEGNKSPTTFEATNARYRDIGRALSDLRDAWVRVELIDKLPDRVRQLPIVPLLRAHFLQEYEQKRETFLQPQVYQPVIDQLKAAKEIVDHTDTYRWFDLFSDGPIYTDPFKDELYRAIPRQMKAAARARRRARRAYKSSQGEFAFALHEWRKRVKRLWYALTLLRPVDPELLDEWIKLLDDMGVMLGDANDCHVMYEEIRTLFQLPADKAALYPSLSSIGGHPGTIARGSAFYETLVHKLAEMHQALEMPPTMWLKSFPPEPIHAEAESILALTSYLLEEPQMLFHQVIEMEREFKRSHPPKDFRRCLALAIEEAFPYTFGDYDEEDSFEINFDDSDDEDDSFEIDFDDSDDEDNKTGLTF